MQPFRSNRRRESARNRNLPHLLPDNPLVKTSRIDVFVMANHNVSI